MVTKGRDKDSDDSAELLFKRLCSLTPKETAYLFRMALCAKSESKYPSQDSGSFLHKIAEATKLPVQDLQTAQAAVQSERQEKLKTRVKDLERKIKSLQKR